MDSKIIFLCFSIYLASQISASPHPVCPATVPATGGGGALTTCTDDSQCLIAGDKCCDVTSGGTGKFCIKADKPKHDDDDDDDCDKKDGKSKEDCHKEKHHKIVVKVVILVIGVVVISVVVGCIIRVKCCKKKITDSKTDVRAEKNAKTLGRDYTAPVITRSGKSQEQAWLSVTPPTYNNSPPPVYTEKY
ncbi:uncharacterized protein LOC125672140 [Ostrea edulis]|uniref:uncharacterized protein LOC125672140 n=1 Tax=Ostrea edulis TaxID=37623 RepID=UPI0024AE9B1E|nr:uncharacterized protein LOC125672140 [Ostrea edulis]